MIACYSSKFVEMHFKGNIGVVIGTVLDYRISHLGTPPCSGDAGK